jgi:LPXTG-motif cell wall-anchored protein
MMTKFKALLVSCATVGALALSGTAHADPYGFDFVLAGQLSPGGSTQVHVEGFAVGAAVEVTLACPSGSTTLATLAADKDGLIDTVVTVGAGLTGKCSIKATGAAKAGGTRSASFAITISTVASAGPVPGGSGSSGSKSGSGLPTTGSDTASPLSIGGGFLALGAVAVAASRVRRRRIAA